MARAVRASGRRARPAKGPGGMEGWRRRIDAIDGEILRLLNERARSALEIGEIKRKMQLPVHDARREMEILTRMGELNRGPLGTAAIRRLFERIIDESRSLERQAAQGEPPAGPRAGAEE